MVGGGGDIDDIDDIDDIGGRDMNIRCFHCRLFFFLIAVIGSVGREFRSDFFFLSLPPPFHHIKTTATEAKSFSHVDVVHDQQTEEAA